MRCAQAACAPGFNASLGPHGRSEADWTSTAASPACPAGAASHTCSTPAPLPAAPRPHLCELQRHLVVHRQQLALALANRRLRTRAALGLQGGPATAALGVCTRSGAVSVVTARAALLPHLELPLCACGCAGCLGHVCMQARDGAPAPPYLRAQGASPLPPAHTLSLRIRGSMRCMVAISSGVRNLISTTPCGSSTAPCGGKGARQGGCASATRRTAVWPTEPAPRAL